MIKRVNPYHLIIVSTPVKLQGLKYIMVGTGDVELNSELWGFWRVIVVRYETELVKII